ncbi:RNA polymerase sigma factor [Geodermatophilus sp. SYSU D00742]
MTGTTSGSAAEDFEGLEALQWVLHERFLLGLVEQLRRQFDNVGSAEVEDAVATAVEKLLERFEAHGPVRDVRSFLARVAWNELLKLTTRRRDFPVERHADAVAPGPEDTVLRDMAVELIKAEIRTWENANIKQVMLVYLDMVVAGDVLETDEIAEIVSENLGEQINPLSVRKWKSRGLRRLREFVEETGLMDRRVAGGEE